MSLDSKHPLYTAYLPDWEMMRDLYIGERAVKEKRETYLPATSGMRHDGMKDGQEGKAAYDAYLLRAVFHDFVRDAVEHMIGLMHQKPANIELPEGMEKLRDKATVTGESLQLLLRRINEQQLVTGRVGLLADLPADTTGQPGEILPYIATYIAESMINWDDGSFQDGVSKLNLAVLDETGFKRNEFTWERVTKYRLLQLGDLATNEVAGTYKTGVFEDKAFDVSAMVEPQVRGKTLNEIPFVFCNTKDLLAEPDNPPLAGLGRLALAIYRGEADYRQNLFMQGQDTLVVIGGTQSQQAPGDGVEDAPLRVGAGARIDTDIGGDAKYIGVESSGLAEQRTALENDCKRAEAKSGQMLSPEKNTQESGAHLTTRLNAQTATLQQIAQTGGAALQEILRAIARWMGFDEKKVIVTPNTEFSDFAISGKDIVDFMTARTMGAPLSKESIHALLVDRGITKKTFEEEMDLIEEEDAQHAEVQSSLPMPGSQAPGGPNDPNTPANQALLQKNQPEPGKTE